MTVLSSGEDYNKAIQDKGGADKMSDPYSQDIFTNGVVDGARVYVTKDGLPMSDDDIEDELHEMYSKIEQLQSELKECREKYGQLKELNKKYKDALAKILGIEKYTFAELSECREKYGQLRELNKKYKDALANILGAECGEAEFIMDTARKALESK